jgi:hypothetical protein
MDLPPGEQGSHTFELTFFLNTADVYFLIDMTGSMADERDKLISDLTVTPSGTSFLDDPSTPANESLSVECSDRDFNGSPDDNLKTKGIAGAIACLIRSSGFGTGFYREIPFSTPDIYGDYPASPWFIGFEHRQDIDENVDLTLASLKTFPTSGNHSWPEAGTFALKAVATGEQVYTGWDRPGIPPRTCADPAKNFGYPCFRKEAVPVVVLITDAPTVNGPPVDVNRAGYLDVTSIYSTPRPDGISDEHLGPGSSTYLRNALAGSTSDSSGMDQLNYEPSGLTHMSSTPDASYHPVAGSASESRANPFDVGVIDNTFITYTGDTRSMTADEYGVKTTHPYCSVWPTGASSAASKGYPDAVYKFTVTDSSKELTISTRGTHHKPVLAILPVISPPTQSGYPLDGTSDGASGQSLGTMTAPMNWLVERSLSAADGDYTRDMFGACMGATSTDTGRDALFSFTPATDMKGVAFNIKRDSSASSSFQPVMALFDSQPQTPTSQTITGTSGANTNDDFFNFHIGTIDGKYVRMMSGNTAAAGIGPDFSETGFKSADASCSDVSGTSEDAVIDFHVATTRRVRVESFDGTGASATGAAGFDHVMALIERPVQLTPTQITARNNDAPASAWVINGSDISDVEGAWSLYTGSVNNPATPPSGEGAYFPGNTITMTSNSVAPSSMYDASVAATSACSAIPATAHDAVFRLNVAAGSEGFYDFDTIGSDFTAYMSLHKGLIASQETVAKSYPTYTTISTNNNAASAIASGNLVPGVSLGSVNGKLLRYSGATNSGVNKWTRSEVVVASGTASPTTHGCRSGSTANSREHVLNFEVTGATARSIRIRMEDDANNDAILSLFGPSATAPNALTAFLPGLGLECRDNQAGSTGSSNDEQIARLLAPGKYWLLVHGTATNTTVDYSLSVIDDTAQDLGSISTKRVTIGSSSSYADTRDEPDGPGGISVDWARWQSGDLSSAGTYGCKEASDAETREHLYKFSLDADASVTLNLYNPDTSIFDPVMALFDAASGEPVAGNAIGGGVGCKAVTNGGTWTVDLTAGSYYLLVYGDDDSDSEDEGEYTLQIESSSVSSSLLACDTSGAGARLVGQQLTAGTYYLVIKGGATNAYDYRLNVRRSLNKPLIACNRDGLGARRSYIETELIGGKNYSVIIRGVTASDMGTYGVAIRDVSYAPSAVACANANGYTTQAYPENGTMFADLQAGRTYYMAVRANDGTAGAFDLSVEPARGLCASDNTPYNVPDDTTLSSLGPSEIKRKFAPGDYYAIIKGNGNLSESDRPNSDNGRGWYQITFGDASLQTTGGTFNAPLWGTSTSGVYADLISRGIRVINITSIGSDANSDPYLIDQANTMSSVTGAVDSTGTPLRRTIAPDGSGMGFAVVDAVASLTETLEMDVSARLVWNDVGLDNPTSVPPGNAFEFVSRAIPRAGNRCAGPIDTNSDGILDTFLNCSPGATPRFEIKIKNPAYPNNVALNPADPTGYGGYQMRLDLIGDNAYIVDSIPVYVIPQDVIADPDDPIFETMGTYTQDVRAAGCTGTDRPTWKSVYWNADIPQDTRMVWRICAGETQAELESCTMIDVAEVTSVGTCADDIDCTGGYCSAGRCEYAIGPACDTASECGTDGVCIASRCQWTRNPIDLKPALSQTNGKSQMRVQVQLYSDATRTKAPTIYDFRLDYFCSPQE